MTFFRWESGVWCDEREEPEADPVYGFDDLEEALEWAGAEGRPIGGHWATIADHDRGADTPNTSAEAQEELAWGAFSPVSRSSIMSRPASMTTKIARGWQAGA